MRGIVAAVLGTVLLTSTGASASTPSGRIVFKRLVGQQFELFKARPDGSGLTRLTRNGHFDEEPDWSPDGRRLLAVADSLVLRSPDGRLLRRLPAVGFDPSWSPNGRLIAYLVGRCPSPKQDDACADLWVIRPDGTGRRRLAAADLDLTQEARPYAWAPDSTRIVYMRLGSPGPLVVVTVRDGSKRALRMTLRTPSSDPSWSSDGRWISFSRQRGPFQGSDLYAVNPAGTRLRLLARGGDVTRATWSPDGRRIAYFRSTAQVDGELRWAVVAADADGRHARRLAVATDSTDLVWSPDSSHLLWSTFFHRLTTARADGGGRPRLVTTGESPDWG